MGVADDLDLCASCGEDLSGVDSLVEEGGKKFCSEECADEYEETEGEVCEFC
ncbi:MAG: hypothetical protein MUP58_02915 [Candidatus Nanohaloarchaeota archaeon QJJ-9]|nr:hypothetical protein [Candidatus Nanohaloarchaeota archaeon QJJ-9]